MLILCFKKKKKKIVNVIKDYSQWILIINNR